MEKQKNGELSRMFGYAGKFHVLTVLGCVLSGISTILSMLPFVCIWLVIHDLIQAFAAGDISLATGSAHYAWMAVVFAAASILIYFIALNCTHLAAFRTATNMRKSAIHHIVTLPLGYFSQNASGRLRNIIDDNAGLTEGFLAHQLPDLTGAAVMPVAVIILIFLFDWRLGICCLIPMGISVIFLKQMMGGDNAQFMGKYMTALETMNKEAVEYIRGIPVVKVFQQTIYSFKNFHAAIEEYEKFASGYALKCRIPLTGFTVTLNGTFVLLIPVAMFILSGVSGQAAYENVVLDFLFYSLFTPVCATMENIRVGKKDATDEEVIAAAKAAQCDEFISKLSDGYQTVIGENGSTLSGGECQRLSIARALLKDAPVILLDEATASLDVDNETEIQNAISRLVKGKTVLIIAHRMRTVEAADNIVVLSDGIVAENGTHEELMKENGLYHRMVDLQTASANWKLSV